MVIFSKKFLKRARFAEFSSTLAEKCQNLPNFSLNLLLRFKPEIFDKTGEKPEELPKTRRSPGLTGELATLVVALGPEIGPVDCLAVALGTASNERHHILGT